MSRLVVNEGLKESNRSINELLIERLRNINKGDPWFGKNIDALLALAAHDSEIIALLLHMLSWRRYVIDALNHKQPQIEMNSNEDWPINQEQNVNDLINEFQISLDQLIQGVEKFPSGKWSELLWHGEYSYATLVNGLIDHDLYHIGQVVILSKMKK